MDNCKNLRTSLLLSLLLLYSCGQPDAESNHRGIAIKSQAEKYFQVFADRQDWEALLSFYDEKVVFQDLNQDLRFEGIEAFQGFYNWPDSSFSKLSPDQHHLEVEELMVLDTVAIARGHFNPFLWKGQRVEGIEDFTIWLYFNDKMKIVKQLDYIEYPAAFLPDN